MKPIIILLFVALYFCSCQKAQIAPLEKTESIGKAIDTAAVIKTWISGKWDRISLTDTLYNSNNKVVTIVSLYPNTSANTLDFNGATTGLDSEIKPQGFTYDLQKMTATIKGNVYNIVKISDKRMNLVRHDNLAREGQLDQYQKQ